MAQSPISVSRVSTGIYGLDDVLHGGLPAGHVYLVEGDPGAGKTTLALQFLINGTKLGEKGLYVSLAETPKELDKVAKSHGISLSGIEIFQVNHPDLATAPDQQYTVFHPSEVELADVMQSVLRKIEEASPSRVVIDSMSEFRMLANEPIRYRRQILSLKQFFAGRDCTALLLDDRVEHGETQLKTVTHGVIRLENLPKEYGIKRRRLEVLKIRASKFREGYHDYVIETGGLRVFPRLVSGEHRDGHVPKQETLASGFPELDQLFGGGIDRGSSTLLIGPAGSGKSTLTAQFATAAAERGEPGAIFTFDEVRHSVLQRCHGLGIPIGKHVSSGRISLQQVDPAELSPGEFVHRIRLGVEEKGWKVVVIDSLNGLMNAMAGEQALTVQLHELLSYLNQVGVATFLVMAQYGILGQGVSSPADVSYLADNVLLLRYFEAQGQVRQAISVVKRRSGMHERWIRELLMAEGRVTIGAPLENFVGVLSGTPEYLGGSTPLLSTGQSAA